MHYFVGGSIIVNRVADPDPVFEIRFDPEKVLKLWSVQV